MKGVLYVALAFAFVASLAHPAAAVPVTISETGVFSSNAVTTTESAPNGTFSFSFTLPNPYSGTPTLQATNFSYTLNGNLLAVGLTSVQFYTAGNGGMFDLNLSDGNIFNVFGTDIGSTGTIATGSYAVTDSINLGSSTGSGIVTVSPAAQVADVPEPASLPLLGLGLLGSVLVRWRRRSGQQEPTQVLEEAGF